MVLQHQLLDNPLSLIINLHPFQVFPHVHCLSFYQVKGLNPSSFPITVVFHMYNEPIQLVATSGTSTLQVFQWFQYHFLLFCRCCLSMMLLKTLGSNTTKPTLLGNGQSSSRSVMTAGPSGSSRGMTCTIDRTTTNHPASLSAMECSLSIDGGGS